MKNYALLTLLLLSQLNAKEPAWINDPTMGGKYIGAIGCAKDINNSVRQEKIALLRAKGSISQYIETDIEDKSHHESTLDNDIFEEEFSFESEQKSSTTFETKQMATYLNQDKLLCVWIVKK
jgi:hypothetical protein